MATNSMASCFCIGKRKGCTCGGICACACTCTHFVYTNNDGNDFTLGDLDWMTVIEEGEENIWPNGECNEVKHKTRKGKGVTSQTIAQDKLRKLPPNCS